MQVAKNPMTTTKEATGNLDPLLTMLKKPTPTLAIT
jgi:hypothetical protein